MIAHSLSRLLALERGPMAKYLKLGEGAAKWLTILVSRRSHPQGLQEPAGCAVALISRTSEFA